MRALYFVPALLLLSGCSLPQPILGYMVETAPQAKTGAMVKTLYSPYFELENFDDKSGVMARLVITLGLERLPADIKQQISPAAEKKRLQIDGLLYYVGEIYFFNYSNQSVEIEPVSLTMDGIEQAFSGTHTIEPDNLIVTEPLITMGLNYRKTMEVTFEYKQNGKLIKVSGEAKRLTQDEVLEKYNRHTE